MERRSLLKMLALSPLAMIPWPSSRASAAKLLSPRDRLIKTRGLPCVPCFFVVDEHATWDRSHDIDTTGKIRLLYEYQGQQDPSAHLPSIRGGFRRVAISITLNTNADVLGGDDRYHASIIDVEV